MYDYNRIIDGTVISTTAAAVYTNVTGVAWIKTIILHNFGAQSAQVTLWDGPESDANSMLRATIPAGQTVFFETPNPGIKKTGTEVVTAKCSVADCCNIRAFGGVE